MFCLQFKKTKFIVILPRYNGYISQEWLQCPKKVLQNFPSIFAFSLYDFIFLLLFFLLSAN